MTEVELYVQDRYVVAGTGSRTFDDIYGLTWLKNAVSILHKSDLKPVFMSGMGQGWDFALAKICAELYAPWVAVIPNPDYIYYYYGPKGSVDGEDHVDEAMEVLRDAKAIEYVMPSPIGTNGRYGGANFDRNQRMVDLANLFLVWDGKSPGTRDCLKRIVKTGLDWVVYPDLLPIKEQLSVQRLFS